jgi:hypothetical protein
MSFKRISIMILIVATVAAFGLAYYFYSQYLTLRRDPNKLTHMETTELLAQVGKLIVLPEDETPTVATVSDPEKLQSQPFFAKAKKGDKVLIFTNAKKAILYDPQNNKIVEVAPINIGPATPTPISSQTPLAP